jgi:hypothetical protein
MFYPLRNPTITRDAFTLTITATIIAGQALFPIDQLIAPMFLYN